MNRIQSTAVATGLSMAMVAGGCGESEITLQGRANGFSQGIETEFTAIRPVQYTDEIYLPYDAYHVYPHKEFDGCKEVNDGPFDIVSMDDAECFGTWCTSGDTSHCEAQYVQQYDFTLDEAVTVLECSTDFPKREFKAPPSRNTACEARAPKDATPHRTTRFFIWVSALKPADAEDPKSQPKTIRGQVEIDRDLWNVIDRDTLLDVRTYEDRVISVALPSNSTK